MTATTTAALLSAAPLCITLSLCSARLPSLPGACAGLILDYLLTALQVGVVLVVVGAVVVVVVGIMVLMVVVVVVMVVVVMVVMVVVAAAVVGVMVVVAVRDSRSTSTLPYPALPYPTLPDSRCFPRGSCASSRETR